MDFLASDVKGGIGSVQSPNWQYNYTAAHYTRYKYITLPSFRGLYNPYHLSPEPE